MTLFDALTLIGGLCLFLFGMSLMGDALERRAGAGLKNLLSKLTTGKMAGFFTGLGVTAIIQSSSATTVMVVGFVNSGLMTLRQAINVIMGANVGTTVTAWLLSMTAIDSGNIFVKLLKPTSFTPVLALVGIILYMSAKNGKRKDTATILLGFATLMFGMDTMSGAVAGLKEVPAFCELMVAFTNPILGVLVGAVLTGIIQSSSASVGILQALSSTGTVTMGAAIPIIMGQNIGTTVTALLSSIGTNRSARRASVVHLCFNLIGTVVILSLFTLAQVLFPLDWLVSMSANEVTIAIAHSIFNVLCTAMLLPATALLEKLAYKIIPEPKNVEKPAEVLLDERLMATPAIALERCRSVTREMAGISAGALTHSLSLFESYSPDTATAVREAEAAADRYEDELGSYLVKLNALDLSGADSTESAKLLYLLGDFERISDHAVSILCAIEEMREKSLTFSDQAKKELKIMMNATEECISLTLIAFSQTDLAAAAKVEPLQEIIDGLKVTLRASHIARMQKGDCSIEAGFVWSDLLTDLERVAAHCSNIAGCVVEMTSAKHDLHGHLYALRANDEDYRRTLVQYAKQYQID